MERTFILDLSPYRSHIMYIEDVERGAELSFSGLRVRFADPPLHHRQILFSNDQILVSDRQTDGRTDGQTDGRTDAINIFWAFLVKN